MSIASLFNLVGPPDDPLEEFDEWEVESLPAHVRACARRYKHLSRQSRANTRLLLVVLLVLVLSAPSGFKSTLSVLGLMPQASAIASVEGDPSFPHRRLAAIPRLQPEDRGITDEYATSNN